MASLPNFTDPIKFPAFADCPLIDTPQPSLTNSDNNNGDYYLLGTITENMTLTPLTPTFICRDRNGHVFAVTLKLRQDQSGEGIVARKGEENFYESSKGKKAFVKGKCVVIKNARRKGAKEENAEMGQKEKKGFVDGLWDGKTPGSGIFVIPTTLEALMQLTINRELSAAISTCSGCSKPRPEEAKTGKCKGCESVWYCGKECQVKGWSEKGHKSECKVLKSVREAFP